MNDEIKEHMQNCIDREESCLLNSDNTKILLDYITNLQHTEDLYNQLLKDYDELEQAYQELKDSKQWWNNRFNVVQRDYEDYKSRCEKAVEYMKKHIEKCNIDGCEGKFDNFDIFTKPQKLLNILNGRSDE